jgi:crotonobetainyl-CoA:carnitine CoA-transferase CaiB-like acyl-CoA transferase
MSAGLALEGVRILDFTQVLAGPFATQQLAQLGADVIKIEQPGTGDMTRGLMSSDSDGMAPSFLTCNLGKRSLTVDLKSDAAQDIIARLVATSDAVVENFKPGTIERLGFGYDALAAIKPDIVYASISGYGQQGPKSELPAFDGAIQASSGMMSISGHPDTGPVRTGYFSVDMSTALNAAFAITGALLRRFRTGEGQHIDVSMMDTAFVMQAAQLTAYLTTDTLPELMGNRSPTKQPTANVFATSDGYIQVVAIRETQIEALYTLLGRPDLFDPEPVARVKATPTVNAFLEPTFASKPTEYWLQKLNEANVPAAPINDLASSATDEQVGTRLSLTEIKHPVSGAQVKIVSSGHTASPAPPVVQRPPPKLGEHTDEVLLELGYSRTDIDDWRRAGTI